MARELGVHRQTVSRCLREAGDAPSKPANPALGTAAVASQCEPFRDLIFAKVEQGLRALLKEPTTQQQLLEDHPVIRPMAHYGWFVHVSFRTEQQQPIWPAHFDPTRPGRS